MRVKAPKLRLVQLSTQTLDLNHRDVGHGDPRRTPNNILGGDAGWRSVLLKTSGLLYAVERTRLVRIYHCRRTVWGSTG